jgi:hypothetical protein
MDQNDKMNFLAQSIKNARKVMEKVETHNVTGNGFTHSKASVTEEDVDKMLDSNGSDFISEAQMIQRKNSTMKNMSTSKMPAAILKSFQENPIIDPTAPIGMESMMQEITKKASPVERIEENTTNKGGYVVESQQTAPVMDTKLIEYIIKKTVEETIDQINKKTSIDENIQIKIGDKTFGGKLSTLKEVKK